jgi:hypothetical protein
VFTSTNYVDILQMVPLQAKLAMQSTTVFVFLDCVADRQLSTVVIIRTEHRPTEAKKSKFVLRFVEVCSVTLTVTF